MVYYWLIFVLFLLLSINGNKSGVSQGDTIRLIIPLSFLFVFFAFRVGFTPDYYNYESTFDNNYGNSFIDDEYRHSNEILYLSFIRLVPYRIALIIQTALFCICMFVTFKYYVPRNYWWIAVVLFFTYTKFILGNISAYRSSFLTMALLLAFISKANLKRGWIPAALIIYITSMIHYSAIILLPVALISDKPLGKRWYHYLVIVACIIIFVSLFMGNSINTIVNAVFEQFTDEFDTYKKDEIANFARLGYFTILRWLMLGYLLFVSLKYCTIDCGRVENVCTKITFIFFLIGFLPGVMLIDRVLYNLAFPAVIGVTSIVNKITNQREKVLYISMAFLYGIWEIYLLTRSAAVMTCYSFYQNILFN